MPTSATSRDIQGLLKQYRTTHNSEDRYYILIDLILARMVEIEDMLEDKQDKSNIS